MPKMFSYLLRNKVIHKTETQHWRKNVQIENLPNKYYRNRKYSYWNKNLNRWINSRLNKAKERIIELDNSEEIF